MRSAPADDGPRLLPTATRAYWVVHTAIVSVVLTSVAVGAKVLFDLPVSIWLILGIAIAVLAADLAFIPMRHRWYRYTVTAQECRITRGRFVQRVTTLATRQILHTEVSQGPILRIFGLAEVRFSLVVGGHDLAPVAAQEAERIRAMLVGEGSGRC